MLYLYIEKLVEGVLVIVVKSETIIQKMIAELAKAKEQKNNRPAMTKHIENVQLLCELILEESPTKESQTPQISDQEMKAMIMGEHPRISQKKMEQYNEPSISEDSPKGEDSIFDF